MEIIKLTTPIHGSLAHKIAEFEALFTYPLGKNQHFRIDHGPHYDVFYRAMGESNTYYTLHEDKIIASLSYGIRMVKKDKEIQKVAYLGDLKIHPNHQFTKAFFNMAQHLKPILEGNVSSAYGIVMEGTFNTPDQYTGRLGIPKFNHLKDIHILRFDTKNHNSSSEVNVHVSKESHFKIYENLAPTPFISMANSHLRSAMEPQWFSIGELACGFLEDTSLAKRLFFDSGEEMLSSHLSYFVYETASQGFSIIQSALSHSHQLGFPAMFLALSQHQMKELECHLMATTYTVAKAAIYGTDNICAEITINTSEI